MRIRHFVMAYQGFHRYCDGSIYSKIRDIEQLIRRRSNGTFYYDAQFPGECEIPMEQAAAFQMFQQFPDHNRIHCSVVKGNPAEMICQEAKTGNFDLIVIGSKGHGLMSSVLLGSVSAKVLHHAPCAVLTIR